MQAIKRIFFLGVVAAGLALWAVPAAAATVTVNVSGVNYTLTASLLSFNADAAKLQAQPWWGNEPLAFAISTALGYQLGDLTGGMNNTIPSALMAYGVSGGDVSITYTQLATVIDCPSGCPAVGQPFFYVTAVSESALIPALSDGSLMLLSALLCVAGILAARRLRGIAR